MFRLNATAILTEENYDVISSQLMLAYDENKLIHLVVNDEEGKKKRLSKIDVLLNKTNKDFMDSFYDRIMELRLNLIGECISNEYDVNNENHYGVISVPKVNNPIQLVIEELPYYCKTKCVSYEFLLFTFWKMIKIIKDQLKKDETDMLELEVRVVEERKEKNFIEFDIGTKKIKSQFLFWTHNEYFVSTLKQIVDDDWDDIFNTFPDYSVFNMVFKSIMDVVSGKKSNAEIIGNVFTKCFNRRKQLESLIELNEEEIPREKTLSKKEKEKLKKEKAKEANKLREQEKKDKAKLAEKQAKQFEKQQKERNKKRIETERKKKLALLKK
jgi:hypothetical protein